jgi:hypothetical protein
MVYMVWPELGTTTLLTRGNHWMVTNTQTETRGLAKLGGRDAKAVRQGQRCQPCVGMGEAHSVQAGRVAGIGTHEGCVRLVVHQRGLGFLGGLPSSPEHSA